MKRILYLAYGIIAYLAFLGTFFYAIGFFGNILLPKTLDAPVTVPFWRAIIINGSLLLIVSKLYGLMSGLTFKKWWIRIIPEPLERISFVLLMSLPAMLVMGLWQPMSGVIWKIENEALQSLIMVLYLSGWMIVFASTFLINHFDLFGIRQVLFYYQGREYESLLFRLPTFYKIVRHPIYIGVVIALWSASTMTAAHLLLSVLGTVYILRVIQLEERAPGRYFGHTYTDDKKWRPTPLQLGKKKAKA